MPIILAKLGGGIRVPGEGVSFEDFAKTLPKITVTRDRRGVKEESVYYLDALIADGDKYSGGKFTPGDTNCYGNSLADAYMKHINKAITDCIQRGYSISAIRNILPDFVLADSGITVSGITPINEDTLNATIKSLIIEIVKKDAETAVKRLCDNYGITDKITVSVS